MVALIAYLQRLGQEPQPPKTRPTTVSMVPQTP
jgi:hypothetical protein